MLDVVVVADVSTVMRIRIAVVLVAVLAAVTVEAAYSPIFTPPFVLLHPGESTTIQATVSWTSGVSYYPFTGPWTFTAEDPSVATIDGKVFSTSAPVPVMIHANALGMTHVMVIEPAPIPPTISWLTVVVAERTIDVRVAVEGSLTPGGEFILTAITDEPDAEFQWYEGSPTRGWPPSWPAGSGPQLVVHPQFPGDYEFWVLARSGGGAAAVPVQIRVRLLPDRKRAVRH